MREIKFRAWDNSRKEMEYINNMYWFEENGVDDINNNVFLDFMQYTGLKDKNDKEIYEGDVVTGVNRIFEGEILQDVNFLNGCFMFGNWNAHEFFNNHQFIEVIGNIYENPELINS
ncbi:putative phage protein (TIGR01671 family) [Cytobacillus horneckiae]|uniref:YopX family protein n=1 Tax=Cytobacillus horneckiae TaxID=549687 RepID=UPI0019D28E70|nr:hypothetical protein [Cytobacillus horneckiae]